MKRSLPVPDSFVEIGAHDRNGNKRDLCAGLQPEIRGVPEKLLSECGVPLCVLHESALGLHLSHEDVKGRGYLRIPELDSIGANVRQYRNGAVRSGAIGNRQHQAELAPARLLKILRPLGQRDGSLKMNDPSL